jgi:3-oxoadipate enol-lactonase
MHTHAADLPKPPMGEPIVVERDGCPLHVFLAGDPARPLVLLLHGAGIDHRLFAPNITALATSHRVAALDLRGHGRSRPMGAPFTAERVLGDLLAVLGALGAREAVIIGHSMGGNLAQELIRRAPERVRALGLVDCACSTVPLSALERLGMRITPALLALYPSEALIRQSAEAISTRPEVRAYVYEAMKLLTKQEIGAVMTAMLGLVRAEPDYRIPRPFLLVRGELSRAGSIRKQGPLWAKREPLCRGEVVIPGAGHCVNLEAPAAFDAALGAFLRSLP